MRYWLALLLVLIVSTVQAGEFEDSGRVLDERLLSLDAQIQILQGNVSELDARMQALEEGTPSLPPVDPDEPVTPVEPGQPPLLQHKLPVRIEAEDYDLGGEGVAYHDIDLTNAGGMYRLDGVDIKSTGDSSGAYQVGWIKPGEWLEFTIGAAAFNYDILLRVSSGHADPGTITVRIDGSEVGVVKVPNTGSYDAGYVTKKILNVPVRAGNQILRLEFSGNNFDLNWIEFKPSGQASINHPPCDIVFGSIEEDPLNPGCVDGTGRFSSDG